MSFQSRKLQVKLTLEPTASADLPAAVLLELLPRLQLCFRQQHACDVFQLQLCCTATIGLNKLSCSIMCLSGLLMSGTLCLSATAPCREVGAQITWHKLFVSLSGNQHGPLLPDPLMPSLHPSHAESLHAWPQVLAHSHRCSTKAIKGFIVRLLQSAAAKRTTDS